MVLEPNEIARRLSPGLGNRCELLRVPRVAHRLLDVVSRVIVEESRIGAEELAIREDGSRERVGQPVERDGVEEFVVGWAFSGPGEELLADPVNEG